MRSSLQIADTKEIELKFCIRNIPLVLRYDFAAFELCWTEFRELRVRVPCETERYLISNYGSEWRVPQPVWDWKSSPPNVRENGLWAPDQMAEAVQLLEL